MVVSGYLGIGREKTENLHFFTMTAVGKHALFAYACTWVHG